MSHDNPRYLVLTQPLPLLACPEAYRVLVEDGSYINTHDIAEQVFIDTNDGSNPPDWPDHRIDHIFVSNNNTRVTQWIENQERFGDDMVWPSDHFLIVADMEF